MLIRSYGLHWRVDEVDWAPGSGRRWRLVGRQGLNRPGLRVADFRDQRGLYVLYGNYGAHYVGLARDRGIGFRLKDHLHDRHKGKWERFSWFGFRDVIAGRDDYGYSRLAAEKKWATGDLNSVIGDMEALLIKALGCPDNLANMKFPRGSEWQQVTPYENEIGLLERAEITDDPFRSF